MKRTEFESKIKPYEKIVTNHQAKTDQPKSAGEVPKPFHEYRKTLTLNGTPGGQDAISLNIGQPRFISAETIVRVNSGRKYGQIAGQAVDRGSTEQGWQLGYGESVFEWRIATRGQKFVPQAYSKQIFFQKAHHVVGTYNGEQMRLYVNGQLVDTKKVKGQGGPIQYPSSTPFIIGAYGDRISKDYFELDGTVYLVRVYAGALSDAQVKSRYDEVKGKINELNQGR